MYSEDMTEDIGRWLPDEGWHTVEVISMEEGTSKQGNSKFTLNIASAVNPGNALMINLTNISGKRWLLRQLLEACAIESEENEEGRKIYNWDIPDIEGKTIMVNVVHDKTPFLDREGNERIIPKAKIIQFKKMSTDGEESQKDWLPPEE